MSVNVTRDVCGMPICGSESVNVFRMWNLTLADMLGIIGADFASDDDFFLCDECFEKIANYADSKSWRMAVSE